MYTSSDLRKGLKIEIDGDPYVVVQFEFSKPGKGKAYYKCKLKNLLTGAQFDRTFRSSDKFDEPHLEDNEMEYFDEGWNSAWMETFAEAYHKSRVDAITDEEIKEIVDDNSTGHWEYNGINYVDECNVNEVVKQIKSKLKES